MTSELLLVRSVREALGGRLPTVLVEYVLEFANWANHEIKERVRKDLLRFYQIAGPIGLHLSQSRVWLGPRVGPRLPEMKRFMQNGLHTIRTTIFTLKQHAIPYHQPDALIKHFVAYEIEDTCLSLIMLDYKAEVGSRFWFEVENNKWCFENDYDSKPSKVPNLLEDPF